MKNSYNIHDCYHCMIFIKSSVESTKFGLQSNGNFVKYAYVYRKKGEYYSSDVTFIDIESGLTYKSSLNECKTGEEYVYLKKDFVPLYEYLNLHGYPQDYTNLTQRDLLKLIDDKRQVEKYILDNPDKVISFKERQDRVSNKPKVRNKILCRIMKDKNKKGKGDK